VVLFTDQYDEICYASIIGKILGEGEIKRWAKKIFALETQ